MLSERRFWDFLLGLAAAGMPTPELTKQAKSKHGSQRVEHFIFDFIFT
jgi:hypothetical protein